MTRLRRNPYGPARSLAESEASKAANGLGPPVNDTNRPSSQGPLRWVLAFALALLLLAGVIYLFGDESGEETPARNEASVATSQTRTLASEPLPPAPPAPSGPQQTPPAEQAPVDSSSSPAALEASEGWEYTEGGAVVLHFGGDEDEDEAPGPRLEGHVYGPDRRPLPGASLVLYRLGPKALSQLGSKKQITTLASLPPGTLRVLLNDAKTSTSKSGQDGEFSLSLPPGAPGDPYLLRVGHHDHATIMSQAFQNLPLEPLEIVLPEPGTLRIEFELAKGAELEEEPSVWVWVPGGWAGSTSVAGIEFRYPFSTSVESAEARAQEERGFSSFSARAKKPISLEPRHLRSLGLVEVVVTTKGCARFRRRLELEAGILKRLVIPLRPMAPISGQVVDETGRPLAGVGLIASGPQGGPMTHSDPEGRFKLELDEDQRYTVRYLDPGLGRYVDVTEASPGDVVQVTVDRSGRGTLEVLDLDTRARETDLWLEAAGGQRIYLGYTGAWHWGSPSGPGRSFGRRAERLRSWLEAQARLLTSDQLPPGDYVLHGRTESDVVPSEGVPLTIRAGERTEVRAGARPGAGVSLQVQAGGKALTQGNVSRLGSYESTDLDSEGRATLSGIDPAGEVFVVRSPGFAPKRVTLGRESALSVELDAGVTLSGLVRDAQGAPLPGAQLMISTKGGRTTNAISDHEGRYQRPFLEPGQVYKIVLFVPYERKTLGEVELPTQVGEHRHDLTLPR